jgi:hypothetical protein
MASVLDIGGMNSSVLQKGLGIYSEIESRRVEYELSD